jgi:hypothetical protein
MQHPSRALFSQLCPIWNISVGSQSPTNPSQSPTSSSPCTLHSPSLNPLLTITTSHIARYLALRDSRVRARRSGACTQEGSGGKVCGASTFYADAHAFLGCPGWARIQGCGYQRNMDWCTATDPPAKRGAMANHIKNGRSAHRCSGQELPFWPANINALNPCSQVASALAPIQGTRAERRLCAEGLTQLLTEYRKIEDEFLFQIRSAEASAGSDARQQAADCVSIFFLPESVMLSPEATQSHGYYGVRQKLCACSTTRLFVEAGPYFHLHLAHKPWYWQRRGGRS